MKYTLLCGQDYKVGRADADILLAEDKSISRSHAFLKISHLEPNVVRYSMENYPFKWIPCLWEKNDTVIFKINKVNL